MDARSSFGDWIEYCFTQAESDSAARFKCSEADARLKRFLLIEPTLLAEYFLRLFRDPVFIRDRFTLPQIAEGVWFIFGGSSFYFERILYDVPDPSLLVDLYRAIPTIYSELFDRVCWQGNDDPEAHPDRPTQGIDDALRMIWDMGGIERPFFNESMRYLREPAHTALCETLMRCKSSPCQKSVLKGLAGIQFGEAPWTDADQEQLDAIIDNFLKLQSPPVHVREYANLARRGVAP